MKKLKKKENNRIYFNKTRHRIFESTSSPKGGSPKSLTQKQVSSFSFINRIFFFLFIFLLPSQLGKHFFPPFSYINGVRVDYLSPTVYLTDVIVFFLLIFNFRKVIDFFKNKKLIFCLVLLLMSIFFARNQMVALYKFIKVIEFIIVFSITRIIFSKINKKTVLTVFSLTGLLQLILVFFQLIYKQSVQGVFYFLGERLFSLSTPGIAKASLNGIEFLRPYGTFSHPNSLAGFFLLLYFFVLTKKCFNKYLFLKYFNLFVFSILIFISFSKLAISTYLILNSFYWILNNKTKCYFCKFTKILTPVFLSLIFLQTITDPYTLGKRIELIKNSFGIILNSPFFGVGFGNYLLVQASIGSKYHLFFNQPVHNIFLLFFSEVGFVIGGLIIFISLNWIKYFIKINSYIFLAVFLTGMFDHYWLTLQQNYLLVAFIYGSVSTDFFIDKFNLRS